MSRNITTGRTFSAPDQSAPGAPATDSYASKVVKLVPVEIISVYLFVFNGIRLLGQKPGDFWVIQWIAFVLILLITPFYLRKIAGIRAIKQIAFCTLTFIVWAFSMGSPIDGFFADGSRINPQVLGGIFLPIYSLAIPIFFPKEDTRT